MALLPLFSQADKTIHNSHKFGFTLSPSNHSYWKAMITPFLVTNNLFGYVDGTIPCPEPTIKITVTSSGKEAASEPVIQTQPNPNFSTWISNDAHVRMLLVSTISEACFQHVLASTSSRDLWLTLERVYSPHTSSREYTLKTQLLKIQMKSDETSSAYLNRAQEYSDALANIGEPIKEKDLVMLVISGLRDEYNGMKSTLLARQFPTAFSELHGLLCDHEYMIRKPVTDVSPVQAFSAVTAGQNPSATTGTIPTQNETLQALQQLVTQLGFQPSNSQQPQAFYTNRASNSRGRGYQNRRGRGSYNNNRREGPNRSQFSWASNQNTVYGTCNRCGIGHVPSQCPHRDPSTFRTRQHPSTNFSDVRSQASTSWMPDTGSSHHVSPDLSSFDNSEAYYGEDNLYVGNGKGLPILHIGSSHLYSPNKTFSLQNVLHVPEIKQNLMSVQKFCHDNNVFFEFHSAFFCVKDEATHNTLLTGPSNGGLYSFEPPRMQSLPKVSFSTSRASPVTWHQRLGHPHSQLLNSMLSKYALPLLNKNKSADTFCDSCAIGKSSKLHLSQSTYKSSHFLELMFCDVWGPAHVPSADGHNYFLLCVDHFSRFMWIFPLKQKSDVFDTFKQFVSVVERQFSTKLKTVQTDWGGEFRNLSKFFASLGITHRLSCPHTSEQNGFVERRHRHVVETGLTLLAHSHVPQQFWHFAFDTAVYLINRMPSRTNSNVSPFELVFQRPPDFNFLRVFGCRCFPHLRPYNKHKMDFRSIPCVFLGYSTSHHGYRCLDTDTDRVYVARHVRFNEHHFPFHEPNPSIHTYNQPPIDPYVSSYPVPDPPLAPNPTTAPNQFHESTFSTTNIPTPPPPPPPPVFHTYQRRHRTSTPQPPTPTPPPPPSPPPPPTRTRPSHLRQNPKQPARYSPTSFHTSPSIPTPLTFTIANKDPCWQKAMAEEFSALQRNGTWSLVPRVPNTNVVNCKWVYKLKSDPTGTNMRYKARLVAKGFNQQAGIDYHETFSPVVKSTTIRVVLSLAVAQQWQLRQLDIENAFLHGDLHETVYLQQPPGFVDPQKPDHVCLLHKALYGLKQAPRAWFQRLSTALQALGFTGSKTDPSLFVYSSKGTLLYMLVYVDDIILTGNNPQAINHIVSSLHKTFAVKDMGNLSYFLGIEIIPSGNNIILSQRKYINELLDKANLSSAKPVPSPITTTANLAIRDSPLFPDPVKYRQIVGALQYVTLSRPDITFAVNKVCQFMHSPTDNHWSAVKRILRYLRGTSDYGLLLQQDSGTLLHAYTDAQFNSLSAYTDADWAGCPDDRRSTGGYAIYLGSNLVSWSARKQRTVSRSSTESEYKALADTVAELTWLQTLLKELRVPTRSIPTLWCDNLGATYLSANPVFHARTKHVEVDFHFVREKVSRRELSVQFISTKDQIADVFTKPLASQRFLLLRSKLQVAPRP
ncbi:hypothetical protein QVD17_22267 [Tagetes erecta]|uniref:Integrase catalytic domain-containing protein n=1 Tax=Tagetes erecta TaxID=13708 RepID=A0AAD8KHN7_TARER|nr:hypothetical protein QVD17_22267 [Tagetes erecta]